MLDRESEITCLLPAGSDPHHFQLSPRQVEKLKQGDLLVRSSKDDHGWIKLLPTMPLIDLWPEQGHAWLNPAEVQKVLPRLAEKLIAVFPERREQIRVNLKRAQASVTLIRQKLKTALNQLGTKGVMMQHPSWRNVFKQFDIPVLAILETSQHGHEEGPRHLEEALKTLNQHPDTVLVGDLQHSNRSLQWLANHAGNKDILYLDALGNCGDDWSRLMQRNIERIQGR